MEMVGGVGTRNIELMEDRVNISERTVHVFHEAMRVRAALGNMGQAVAWIPAVTLTKQPPIE